MLQQVSFGSWPASPDYRMRLDSLAAPPFVSAPTVEGSIGLLPGHVPILSVLRAGTVKVVQSDGVDHYVDVSGGFLSFDHDMVTIVAEPVDAS